MAGIYIHIPFCRQACNYCNFHFSVSLKNKEVLINALIKEIETENNFIKEQHIETIYIGGGTPSLLNEYELEIIFKVLQKKYLINNDVEITLEANPDDVNENTLEIWKRNGINRLSVGLQSFNEEELKWMNRAHNATQSLKCLDDIRHAGFTNFSVDLIYRTILLVLFQKKFFLRFFSVIRIFFKIIKSCNFEFFNSFSSLIGIVRIVYYSFNLSFS